MNNKSKPEYLGEGFLATQVVKETEVLVLHESAKESIISDVFTVLSIGTPITLGWMMGSDAMQWFGFILGMFSTFIMALRSRKLKFRRTPQEAADYLKERYGVQAKERG